VCSSGGRQQDDLGWRGAAANPRLLGLPVLVRTVVSSVILEKTTWSSGTGVGRKCRLGDELCAWLQGSKVCPPAPWAWPRQGVFFQHHDHSGMSNPCDSQSRGALWGWMENHAWDVLQLQSREASCSIPCCARGWGVGWLLGSFRSRHENFEISTHTLLYMHGHIHRVMGWRPPALHGEISFIIFN